MGCAAFVIREVVDTPYGSDYGRAGEIGPSEGVDPLHAVGRSDAGVAMDPDAIEELADEIATIAAHIHAATHRLLVLIAEFDRVRGWELAGYSDCARWLATRTGIDLGAAREKVRAARALVNLPLTSVAMSRGELSFSQVRALTRVARADTEAELLELARGTTTAQLERMVRAWKKGSRTDEAAWERERYRSRTFSVFPDDDGMYVVTGRLMPEVGALLLRAIEAASDALFRERRTPGLPDDSSQETEASQRRADAVGLVAERALTAGFGRVACGRTESEVHDPDPACRCVETDVAYREPACRCVAGDGPASATECAHSTADAPISGTRTERYQVVLHVDPQTLAAEGEAVGACRSVSFSGR